MTTSIEAKFGPVRLAPGYTRWNAQTYLFAAFITIGMLAFISFIQPYLLNANLKVPADEQGRALGLLGFANEIVSLLLVAPFGALSDKIGRRPVYAIGFVWLAAGFFLYPKPSRSCSPVHCSSRSAWRQWAACSRLFSLIRRKKSRADYSSALPGFVRG